jgi:hypothetical protein
MVLNGNGKVKEIKLKPTPIGTFDSGSNIMSVYDYSAMLNYLNTGFYKCFYLSASTEYYKTIMAYAEDDFSKGMTIIRKDPIYENLFVVEQGRVRKGVLCNDEGFDLITNFKREELYYVIKEPARTRNVLTEKVK